jgi:hypothetical protein
MARIYNVIDADGHVLEPVDIWDKYIDPAYRDRAPRRSTDAGGCSSRARCSAATGAGNINHRPGAADETTMKYVEYGLGLRPARADRPTRIRQHAAFLYPSVSPRRRGEGARPGRRHVPGSTAGWPILPSHDRLFGGPCSRCGRSTRHRRDALRAPGMRAAFPRPNPYNDLHAHHPDYNRSGAEELDVAIGCTGRQRHAAGGRGSLHPRAPATSPTPWR